MSLQEIMEQSAQEIKDKSAAGPQKPAAELQPDKTPAPEGVEGNAPEQDKEPQKKTEPQKDNKAKEPKTEPAASAAAAQDKFEEYLSDGLKPKYAALPPEAQAAFKEAYKDMQAGFSKKAQATSAFEKEVNGFFSELKPLTEKYENSKDFINNMRGLQNFEAMLVEDPVRTIKILCEKTNTTPEMLANYTPNQAHEAMRPVLGELAALKNLLNARGTPPQAPAPAEINTTQDDPVSAFKNATGADGKPLHPHFEKVANIMGFILQRDGHGDLEKAYNDALMTLPETREALIKAETAKAQKAQAELEKAKRANGVKVKAPSVNAPSDTKQSLKEMLLESAEEIKNR